MVQLGRRGNDWEMILNNAQAEYILIPNIYYKTVLFFIKRQYRNKFDNYNLVIQYTRSIDMTVTVTIDMKNCQVSTIDKNFSTKVFILTSKTIMAC